METTDSALQGLLGQKRYEQAQELWGDDLTILQNMESAELNGVITPYQAKTLRCVKDIMEQANAPPERPQIRNPQSVADLLWDMNLLDHEEFRIVLLNTRNRVMGVETLYKGSLNSASIRIGEIFRLPIIRRNASIICAHNHPGGDPTPSPDDVGITAEIVKAGKLLDIEVIDHIIIAGGRFCSLKEKGLWPHV